MTTQEYSDILALLKGIMSQFYILSVTPNPCSSNICPQSVTVAGSGFKSNMTSNIGLLSRISPNKCTLTLNLSTPGTVCVHFTLPSGKMTNSVCFPVVAGAGVPGTPPPPVVVPPSAPTGLVVTPGDTTNGVSWNSASTATGYHVKRSIVNGGPYTVIVSLGQTLAYTDVGLTDGVTYYYVISAFNTGGESANSVQVSATPVAPSIPPSGSTIDVPAGDATAFQAALNAAVDGDIITLVANSVYSGHFTLPVRANQTTPVTVRSINTVDVPGVGVRTGPAYAAFLPKIVTPDTAPALATLGPATGWTFENVEIKSDYALQVYTVYDLVLLGTTDGNTEASLVAELPVKITFDRCYLHGTTNGNVRRGIALNAVNVTVKNSYFSDFHEMGAEAQGMGAWNGGLSVLIDNNYVAGASQNILFGGAGSKTAELSPSDIVITNNTFEKPDSWRVGSGTYAGNAWVVKNHIELKHATNVTIDHNVFNRCWDGQGQDGACMIISVLTNGGTSPWATVQNVTITNNRIMNVGTVLNVSGTDPYSPAVQGKILTFRNNLAYNVGSPWTSGGQYLYQFGNYTPTVIVDHNTIDGTNADIGRAISFYGSPIAGFVFQNNFLLNGTYGVFGDGQGSGTSALAFYAPSYVFAKNVLGGGDAPSNPTNNFYPSTSTYAAQFVNPSAGDYTLTNVSAYNNAATDGTDIGVDMSLIPSA